MALTLPYEGQSGAARSAVFDDVHDLGTWQTRLRYNQRREDCGEYRDPADQAVEIKNNR